MSHIENYQTRLNEQIARRGRICVGIDPMPSVLDAWGLQHDPAGLERCARTIVETLGEHAAVFKPQSAFFEAYGSAGIAVLERVMADIRAAGALSILDVKRGDIGSSVRGYADAYLAPEAPLAADAITLSPYLGVAALAPACKAAALAQRGVYLLCRTSNPEGAAIQTAQTEHKSVAQLVVDTAVTLGPHVGLVIGATHAQLDVALGQFRGSILVPGLGAQGGTLDQIKTAFGECYVQTLPTASRAIIGGGEPELLDRFRSFMS